MTKSRQDIELLYEKLDEAKRKSTRDNSVIGEASRIISEIVLNIDEERKKSGNKKKEGKKKNRETMERIESCGGNELLVALLDHPKGDVRADSVCVVMRIGLCAMSGGYIPLEFRDEEGWKRKGNTITKIREHYDSCTIDKEITDV
jgi:hypothetical protein